MLWFYLQPFFGNHTQKRETETELKHMPPEAYPRRSDCHPRPFHVTMSALFLFLPFFCLRKPICSNPPSSKVPSIFVEQCPNHKASSEVPSSFVVPSIFSCSNSTRFGCIPPHPSLKPRKPIPQTHYDEPTTSTNPFRKPISQTPTGRRRLQPLRSSLSRSISLSLNLSLFLPPLIEFVNKRYFDFDFWLC